MAKIIPHTASRKTLRKGVVETYGSYDVEINPKSTLLELLALGNYDTVMESVYDYEVEDEDKEAPYSVKLELMVFTRGEPLTIIEKRFKKLGYRPATLRELLSFGAQHPAVQLDVLITSFGIIERFSGKSWYACLYCWLDERVVYYAEADATYRGKCYFAFVKE